HVPCRRGTPEYRHARARPHRPAPSTPRTLTGPPCRTASRPSASAWGTGRPALTLWGRIAARAAAAMPPWSPARCRCRSVAAPATLGQWTAATCRRWIPGPLPHRCDSCGWPGRRTWLSFGLRQTFQHRGGRAQQVTLFAVELLQLLVEPG